MGKSSEQHLQMRDDEVNGVPMYNSAPKDNLPTKKSIYNIHEDYLRLMDEIEQAEGELSEDLDKRLTINKAELETKSVSYGYVIRQFDAEVEQISKEIERLSKLSAAKTKAQQGLKDRIKDAMLAHGITKIQQNNLTLSFRKSEQLIIDQGAHIPIEYISTKETEVVDKAGIKAAVKAGAEFIGIFIQENQNLQIK